MIKRVTNQWLSVSALIIGFVLTFLLQQEAMHVAQEDLRNDFAYQAKEITDTINQRLGVYEQMLRASEGLFAASGSVDRGEFRNYTARLRLEKNYPGIQGIGFALIVSPQLKTQHIDSIRKEGFLGYTIRPEGERPLYTTIIYLEPFEGRNLNAFGYDMYSEPVRRTAMERARDQGEVAMTGKVTLVQENGVDVQTGFLLYVPVYRQDCICTTIDERRVNIIGWVYAPFRSGDFINALLNKQMTTELGVEVYDGESISPNTLMFSNTVASNTRVDTPWRWPDQRIEIAGHTWSVRLYALTLFQSHLNVNRVNAIRYLGTFISLLLCLLVWLLVNGRARALKLAEKMTHALSERELSYRQMFENNKSIAYLLNPANGDIVDVNEAAASFWGYSRATLRKMNISEIDLTTLENSLLEINRSNETANSRYECKHRLKNGEIHDIEVYNGPITFDGQTIIYSIAHDISERKRAEERLQESESRFRAIADAAPVLIWLSGVDKLCYWFNVTWLNFTGRAMEQEIGNGWAEGVHRDDFQRCLDHYVTHFDKRQPFRMQYRIRHRDGDYRWLDDSGVPRYDEQGDFCGYIGSCIDITVFKRVQADLARSHAELQRFAEIAAHHLQEPTRRLVSYSRHLRSRLANRVDGEEALQALIYIEEGSARMRDLVQDIESYLASGAPRGAVVAQDTAAIWDALIQRYAARLSAASATVETEPLPFVMLDKPRLINLLEILLDNAIAHRLTDTQTHIRISGGQRETMTYLRVEDNGPGIPAEYRQRVFEVFERLTRNPENGTGIGLAVARRIVESQGGNIAIDTSDLGGAAIMFELPSTPKRY